MALQDVARMDKKGRILIPKTMRALLKIGKGDRLLLVPNGRKELSVFPAKEEGNVVINVKMADLFPSLKSVINFFKKTSASVINSESQRLDHGSLYEWNATLTDVKDIGKIKNNIGKIKGVREVKVYKVPETD